VNALQDHWQTYKASCYPAGMTTEQHKQLHQAFFAGALVMMQEMQEASEHDDEGAVRRMDSLINECLSVNQIRLNMVKGRN
jgi:hypothetical protein